MRKLGTLFFATLLTLAALVPERAGAYGGYVCDEDCECSWACPQGRDGICIWVDQCLETTGGNACGC